MIPKTRFFALEAKSPGYYIGLAIAAMIAAAGGLAAWYMGSEGHYVTGMDNQIVWGLPHVSAIFLILISSGVLNVAAVGTMFKKAAYKPMVRLAALVSGVALVGGLAVLVLDLGRPDRLIVAMTHYNFKSIFAWNIILYTGLFVLVILYSWTLFERRMGRMTPVFGLLSLVWRFLLTACTGAIFAFIVARSAYDSALMVPQFLLLSLSQGMSVFILILVVVGRFTKVTPGNYILFRMKNLLGIFVLALAYFTIIGVLAKLYGASTNDALALYAIGDGFTYTLLFAVGYIGAGSLLPAFLFYVRPFSECRYAALTGVALVPMGGLVLLYTIIIGGQALPMPMFPGMIESSDFYDGVVNEYLPSLPEILLAVGGVALSAALLIFMLAVLRFLPSSLADSHLRPEAEN